jgi:hypothetical protein
MAGILSFIDLSNSAFIFSNRSSSFSSSSLFFFCSSSESFAISFSFSFLNLKFFISSS